MPVERLTTGAERALIENMLDRNREALIATARGLSEEAARRRLVTSLTTPISLLKHAACAERIWFQRFWAGLDAAACDGYSERDLDDTREFPHEGTVSMRRTLMMMSEEFARHAGHGDILREQIDASVVL